MLNFDYLCFEPVPYLVLLAKRLICNGCIDKHTDYLVHCALMDSEKCMHRRVRDSPVGDPS